MQPRAAHWQRLSPVQQLTGVCLAMIVAATGCAHGRAHPHAPTPEEYRGQDHPLNDHIYDLAAGVMISEDELMHRLATKRFVLLGEKHDNALHHRGQAAIIAAMVAAGRHPALGWEMINTAQDDALAAWVASKPSDGSALGPAIAWKKSGWPPWAMYQPIADVAAAAQLPMVAGGLPRDQLMKLYQGEGDFLASDDARALGVNATLPADMVAALAESITESHCGHAPKEMLDPMVVIQQVKDAHMAKRLVDADGDGAVLIAGGEHVRRDRAVPFFLRGHPDVADDQIAIVSFEEVQDDATKPTDYDETVTAFDYLWFTTRVTDADPCEEFRKQLEKLDEGHPTHPTT